jgi:hypothetical protein
MTLLFVPKGYNMSKEENYSIRSGKGIRWQMINCAGPGHRETINNGFTIDNLDTKTLEQAESIYEELFISVRGILEKNEAHCMDVESERLTACQEISDCLKRLFLFEKRLS